MQIEEKVEDRLGQQGRRLQATAVKAMAAARAHDKDAIPRRWVIDSSCESCHKVYWYPDEEIPRACPARAPTSTHGTSVASRYGHGYSVALRAEGDPCTILANALHPASVARRRRKRGPSGCGVSGSRSGAVERIAMSSSDSAAVNCSPASTAEVTARTTAGEVSRPGPLASRAGHRGATRRLLRAASPRWADSEDPLAPGAGCHPGRCTSAQASPGARAGRSPRTRTPCLPWPQVVPGPTRWRRRAARPRRDRAGLRIHGVGVGADTEVARPPAIHLPRPPRSGAERIGLAVHGHQVEAERHARAIRCAWPGPPP